MRTRAIVIKKTAMNEYDQMITCYSEDFGGMRAIARGSLRPTSVQSLHLDMLNMIEFEVIHGRTYPIVSSAESVAEYPIIKSSLTRLAAVQFFMEVLDRIMFENEKDAELWNFLSGLLEHFDSVSEDAVLASFRRKQKEFLEVLGYAPRVDRCVVCSKDALSGPEKMVAVSPELGGVLCPDCFIAGGRGLLFEKAHIQNLTGAAAAPVRARNGALDTFFEYIVGSQLNSLVFLYQSAKI